MPNVLEKLEKNTFPRGPAWPAEASIMRIAEAMRIMTQTTLRTSGWRLDSLPSFFLFFLEPIGYIIEDYRKGRKIQGWRSLTGICV